MFLVLIFIAVAGTVATVICILRPKHPSNLKVIASFFKWGRFILGLEIKIINGENFDKYRPCVFISNHQDNLDVFPGSFSLPDRTVTLGKKSILYIPFFGMFYWLSGNILIDRKNKKSAWETMDLACKTIKDKNISVWIMPEGTRSKGKGLLPFKKGPFQVAIKAQVPIVPIAWSSYHKNIDLKKWNAGTILIEAMTAIETKGLTVDDLNHIKNQAYQMIHQKIEELDQINAQALGKISQ